MREFCKTTEQETSQHHCHAPTVTNHQTAGNGAAQAGITAESPTLGFLDGLMDLEGPGTDTYDWAKPRTTEATQDELVRDQLDLGAEPAWASDNGGAQVTPKGVDLTHVGTTRYEDDLLGKSHTDSRTRASIDKDALRLGYGRAHSDLDGDFGMQGGVLAGTDGSVTGNAGVRAGDLKVGAGGKVDFDEEGGLEQLAMNASAGKGGTEMSAGLNVAPGSVKVEGNTVTYAWSAGAEANARVSGQSVGGGLAHGKRETRTFTTPEEAQAFAGRAREDSVKSNRELTSTEVREMPEGTSFTYGSQTSANAALFASGNASAVDQVEVVCGKGSKVQITLTVRSDAGVSLGADNGVIGSQLDVGAHHRRSEEVYDLDLSDPIQKAEFDALQAKGTRPTSVEPTLAERLDGTQRGLSATLPGMSISQQSCEEHGERIENGQHHHLDRGTASSGVMDLGWSALPYAAQGIMNAAAGVAGEGSRFEKSANGFGKLGDQWYEQGLAEGSQAGSERSTVEVLTPFQGSNEERLAGQHLLTTEVMDFDDRRQTARSLQDMVDPLSDTAEIDEAVLPEAGVHDARWILESEINAEGAARIRDDLASGLVDYEFGAAKNVEWLRDEHYGADMTALDHAEAMAAFGRWGGQDAAEGMRHVAGEENVENYLQLDGDDTWIGRTASHDLDEDVRQVTESGAVAAARDLAPFEQARLTRLMNPDLYPEVPQALIDEEVVRTTRRLDTLSRLAGQ